MSSASLQILARTRLEGATLLLALTGWMDGGLVSTGTVRRMMENRKLIELARIDPDPYYIYNMPGSMEVAALFRPEVKMDDGVIQRLEMPSNTFWCDPAAGLVFFIGKEPNLRWQAFAECIFEVARDTGVARIIFIGSFGGTVPHTREPRMFGSVSHPHLRKLINDFGMGLSDYEGPCSFYNLLLHQSPARNLEMLSLVSEIPGYLSGINPLSIEAVTRRLARILNQPVDLDGLRRASDQWELQVTQAVEQDEKLAETVRQLEEQYDNELIGRSGEGSEGGESGEGESKPD